MTGLVDTPPAEAILKFSCRSLAGVLSSFLILLFGDLLYSLLVFVRLEVSTGSKVLELWELEFSGRSLIKPLDFWALCAFMLSESEGEECCES